MKLLYIANIRLPTEKAHGIQIMKTCEAFTKAGVEIELVVPTRHNELTANPFTYYGVPENSFRLVTLRVPDLIRYGRLGFLVLSICFSERARWGKSFWAADVIYSRDALILMQYLLLGRKLVFEAHGKPMLVSRFVAKRAYRVVVISKALGLAYQEAGVPREKIIIAPDAVDAHMFDDVPLRDEARVALGFASDTPIVVYTGHLYVRKGVEVLAQAAILIPEMQFFFVGGTADDIIQFRARWGSQSNIHIVGHVSPAQVPLHLRSADVLVIPNSGKDQDAREFTSPMKLFEYMASGTPIIASDVPSIREVLDEQTATFFTPDDPAALAAGITDVLFREQDAQQKARNAQQKASEYTWEKRAMGILAAIHTTSL